MGEAATAERRGIAGTRPAAALALALLAATPAAAAPGDAASGPEAVGPTAVERPISHRSLVLSLDGERGRRSGGDAFDDASFSIRGATALAGRARLAPDGFSAWGIVGHAEARGYAADLPEIEGTGAFLHLGLSLGALYAPSAADAFELQAGAFVAEQVSLLDAPRLHPHAVAAGSHRASDRMRLLYGFGYSYALGRGLPLPFAGVDWRLAPAWRLEVLLPVLARATWQASDALALGGGVSVKGDQFRYQARDATGATSVQDLHVARLRLGALAAWSLGPGVRLELEAGVEGASIDTGLSTRSATGAYLTASVALGARPLGQGIAGGDLSAATP